MTPIFIKVAIKNVDMFYTYKTYQTDIAIGDIVKVPFINKYIIAVVIEILQNSDYEVNKIKEISNIIYKNFFSDELLKTLNFASQYYFCPLGRVLFSAIPNNFKSINLINKSKTLNEFQITDLGKKVFEFYKQNKSLKNSNFPLDIVKMYKKLHYQIMENIIDNQTLKLTKNINLLLEYNIIKKVLVVQQARNQNELAWNYNLNQEDIINIENKLTLNEAQQIAYNTIDKNNFAIYVLDGVTGSGKTEVYLHLIENCLKNNKTALLLVPEIGLTPQTTKRFLERFNVPIEILHSNISDIKRLETITKIKNNQSAIIIGTRSCVFSDLYNLGIIIIDEEHDSSYKQKNDFCYHARDISIIRAKALNIPCVMGSATPSFRTVFNILNNKYQHLVLPNKALAKHPPHVNVLRTSKKTTIAGLSHELLRKIKIHTDVGNQVLIFLNRRGFSPILECTDCHHILQCPGCDKNLTYHLYENYLSCHICGFRSQIPQQCPDCSGNSLVLSGYGTEQIEKFLQQYYHPDEILRIDRDTVKNQNSMNAKLQMIHQNHAKILIGTQMIAKGHHFPNVTLAAIINIDGLLFMENLHAIETLAQIYIQVAGRAGREEKTGEVVLQTSYPDDTIIKDVLSIPYFEFAKKYIKLRNITYRSESNVWVYNTHIVLYHTNIEYLQQNTNIAQTLLANIIKEFIPEEKNVFPSKYNQFSVINSYKLAYKYYNIIEINILTRSYLQLLLTNFIYKIEEHKINFYIDIDPY